MSRYKNGGVLRPAMVFVGNNTGRPEAVRPYVGSARWWTEVVLSAPLHASPMLPTPMREEGADP